MTASPVREADRRDGRRQLQRRAGRLGLDAYVLALAGKPRPKICFVPTASGDAPEYATKFYDSFARRAEASHLYLFGRPRTDMARPSREPGHHLRRRREHREHARGVARARRRPE